MQRYFGFQYYQNHMAMDHYGGAFHEQLLSSFTLRRDSRLSLSCICFDFAVADLEIPRLHPISTWNAIYNLLASGYDDDHRNQSRTNYAHVVRNLIEDTP